VVASSIVAESLNGSDEIAVAFAKSSFRGGDPSAAAGKATAAKASAAISGRNSLRISNSFRALGGMAESAEGATPRYAGNTRRGRRWAGLVVTWEWEG
jgi:hypothetical protein